MPRRGKRAGRLKSPGLHGEDLRARVDRHVLPSSAVTANDQNVAVLKQCRRVALTRHAHRSDSLGAPGRGIVQLGAPKERPRMTHASGKQDPTIRQERRGMATARLDKRTSTTKLVRGRLKHL